MSEAHGKGAALQLNRYLEEGSVVVLSDGKHQVNFSQLETSVTNLVRSNHQLQLGLTPLPR